MEVHIYALIDPRNNEPFYVGRSINVIERVKQHITDAKHPQPWINKKKTDRVRDIIESGKCLDVKILDVVELHRPMMESISELNDIERCHAQILINDGHNIISKHPNTMFGTTYARCLHRIEQLKTELCSRYRYTAGN